MPQILFRDPRLSPTSATAHMTQEFMRSVVMVRKDDAKSETYVSTVEFKHEAAIRGIAAAGEAMPGQCASFQLAGKEVYNVDLSYFWLMKAPSLSLQLPLLIAKGETLKIVSDARIVLYLIGNEHKEVER